MGEMNPTAYPYVDKDGRLGLHGEALRHRALKGPNISAQGNALGIHTKKWTSPEGAAQHPQDKQNAGTAKPDEFSPADLVV